jgi:hypothetical protein
VHAGETPASSPLSSAPELPPEDEPLLLAASSEASSALPSLLEPEPDELEDPLPLPLDVVASPDELPVVASPDELPVVASPLDEPLPLEEASSPGSPLSEVLPDDDPPPDEPEDAPLLLEEPLEPCPPAPSGPTEASLVDVEAGLPPPQLTSAGEKTSARHRRRAYFQPRPYAMFPPGKQNVAKRNKRRNASTMSNLSQ